MSYRLTAQVLPQTNPGPSSKVQIHHSPLLTQPGVPSVRLRVVSAMLAADTR